MLILMPMGHRPAIGRVTLPLRMAGTSPAMMGWMAP
jgi:hypothetical protein